MNGLRRLAPIALAAALRSSLPSVALADPPKPSGAAKQAQDLIARGQSLFEDQQYEESIQTLSGALVRPNNTHQEKLEIYRLLALNYITLTRREEAEGAVRGLLALEPSYELPARESPRFRDFFGAAKKKWEKEGRPGLAKEVEAPPAPVILKHASPAEATAGEQIDLTATIEDPQSRVAKLVLHYRSGAKTGSDATFEQVAATLVSSGGSPTGHASAAIPPEAVKPPIVEYYLEGLDKTGLPIVSRGDAAAPLRIAVPERMGAWVIPTVIAGAVVFVAGGIFGGLAAAGVFNKPDGANKSSSGVSGQSSVNVNVGSSSAGFRW